MSMRYIADLHLYDLYCWDWRNQFDKDFRKMNDYLIEHWNSVCSRDDKIIIAGDVGNCCEATFDVLHELNGMKILVLGNHDTTWGYNV